MGVGISTKDTCPFTFGVDVSARLFARATAPGFKWPGAEVAITPAYKKPIIKGGTCPGLGPLPTKRDLGSMYLTIDGNNTRSHSHGHGHTYTHNSLSHEHGHTHSSRALAKRAAVWGPVLSVPVGSYFCPPESDDSASPGTVCSKIGPIYGFQTTDCKDFKFSVLSADVASVTYQSEHILEAQLIKQFFEYVAKNVGRFPHPNPNVNPDNRIDFCTYVKLLWSVPVAIPNLDTASGTSAILTAFKHVVNQFPTSTWKKEEYVSLERNINAPPKGNAWAGLTSSGNDIQIIDLKKWIGADPDNPGTSKITNVNGAEEIMKSMRAILGSRLYHNTPAISTIPKAQKERVLPANPKKKGWTPWKPLGLKGKWDTFMTDKMLLVVSKSNMWADQAARDAAKPNDDDDTKVVGQKKRRQRLIDTIDAFDAILKTAPKWELAF
ncbi:hypothetical protein VE00_02157 [Pseudogymnoascus sp. WSF 3629]|nr:hypothetical protein VE00_02157 [Pseudogymnoascus sp. WSF 3629]